ncbi:MAG TPA: hypothetical protein VMR95_01955 [Candidatus Binatia bacterium]|nr:hypothetical protein [Candidatus Binatia bacterium]
MTIEGLRKVSPTDLMIRNPGKLDGYLSELPYSLPFSVIDPKTRKLNFLLVESINSAVAATRKAEEALGTFAYNASKLKAALAEDPDSFSRLTAEQNDQAMEIISRLAPSESAEPQY